MVSCAAMSFASVGDDVVLGDLAALDDDGADAVEAIEGRLELVGGEFPEAGLRDGVGGESVAEDGEGGEGEAVGGDDGGGGERLLRRGRRRR